MGTKAQAAPLEKSSPCIARQPILTVDETVIGYELLFRDSDENKLQPDGERASSAMIEMLNFVGLSVLCDGRLAFINCTQQMLLSEYMALLPPYDVVMEIQDSVLPEKEVIQACERLGQAGFSIALDNFVPGDKREALIPYARFIKVDIYKIRSAESTPLVKRYANEQCQMVATKVESREQFLTAQKCGFTRFQGYFFRFPENIKARRIPANQATYVRLLTAVSKPAVDFVEVEELIKREPSLCYRLLRYLNSPLLGLSSPVTSVRNALNLLGEREAVRWIRMATTLVMGQDKSSDLVLASLVRARFCELVGQKVAHGNTDVFLMGMLSLIDAILAVPIGVALEELALDPVIKAQLLGAKRGEKTALSPIYDLMLAREEGDWGLVAQMGKQLNLSLSYVAQTSNAAMRWAHDITSTVRTQGAGEAAR
jgi:c-di-GMP-related signal transduction protein